VKRSNITCFKGTNESIAIIGGFPHFQAHDVGNLTLLSYLHDVELWVSESDPGK
jgi:hypothetical protein